MKRPVLRRRCSCLEKCAPSPDVVLSNVCSICLSSFFNLHKKSEPSVFVRTKIPVVRSVQLPIPSYPSGMHSAGLGASTANMVRYSDTSHRHRRLATCGTSKMFVIAPGIFFQKVWIITGTWKERSRNKLLSKTLCRPNLEPGNPGNLLVHTRELTFKIEISTTASTKLSQWWR